MKRLSLWWQEYRDRGYLGTLGIYLAVSYGLGILISQMPHSGMTPALFVLQLCLSAIWLVSVICGSFYCGWPSLLLWIPGYWFLLRFLAISYFLIACALGLCA